ncbi:MAG: 3H domain-containing protein [Flavonifractor plautii]
MPPPLAREFSVSRQIIVGDVALFAGGRVGHRRHPTGLRVCPKRPPGWCALWPVSIRGGHGPELEIMVDQGCQVMDVVVEHPVYGQLTGQPRLASRYDVQEFVRLVSQRKARPLSDLTGESTFTPCAVLTRTATAGCWLD